MGFVRIITIAVSVLLLGMPLCTRADTPSNALIVVAEGDGVSQEFANDVTEALIFSLSRNNNQQFLPKERVQRQVKHVSPKAPGACVSSVECLRKAMQVLRARSFIVVRFANTDTVPRQYKITVTRVGDRLASDNRASGKSELKASALISKSASLVVEVNKTQTTTLSVHVQPDTAEVTIDGVRVSAGSGPQPVRAGARQIRVTHKGYVAQEKTLVCTVGAVCTVTIRLARITVSRAAQKTPLPVPAETSSGLGLRIAGWTTLGVGTAMTIVGAVFGAKVNQIQNELDKGCTNNVCRFTATEAKNKRNDGLNAANIFNYVGIPGMILAVSGGTMLIISYLNANTETSSKLQITPVLSPDGTIGVRAAIRF